MNTESSNLALHRAPESVWDRQDSEHARSRVMGMVGLLLIAAGTCLVAQGYRSQIAAIKGRVSPLLPRVTRADAINEAAEESFPASDPPGWTPATGKAAQSDAT